MFGVSGESPRVPVSVERIFVFYLYLLTTAVGITIMETNKIGHFICGVLATYGLVVACGNMENSVRIDDGDTQDQNPEGDSGCLVFCVKGLIHKVITYRIRTNTSFLLY